MANNQLLLVSFSPFLSQGRGIDLASHGCSDLQPTWGATLCGAIFSGVNRVAVCGSVAFRLRSTLVDASMSYQQHGTYKPTRRFCGVIS